MVIVRLYLHFTFFRKIGFTVKDPNRKMCIEIQRYHGYGISSMQYQESKQTFQPGRHTIKTSNKCCATTEVKIMYFQHCPIAQAKN